MPIKAIISLLAICALLCNSMAQKKWLGPITGNWENAAYWSPAGVPGNTDTVILDNSFQKSDYTVTLPDSTITIRSLSLAPFSGNRVELVIPLSNKSSPAFVVDDTGKSINISRGGILRNSSGLSGGQSVSLHGLMSIFDGGKYVHNSRSSHANEIVANLSTAPGTQKGEFEFDVPGGSYPISFSNRNYGTLILSSGSSGGTQVYNASGANPATIYGDFLINKGVQFNLDLTKDMIINGDYYQSDGVFNIASQSNNNTIKIKGAVHQSPAGTIIETSGGLPVLELCGDVSQHISFSGRILNSITVKVNNPGGIALTSPLALPYKLLLTYGAIKTSKINILTLLDNCLVSGGSTDSFIDGPIRKTGDEDFEFPVGKQGDYAPLKISGPGGATTDEFTAEYFLDDPVLAFGASFDSPPLVRISKLEFWTIERIAGSTTKKIRLSVGKYSNATDLSKLVLIRWDDEKKRWKNEGNSSFTGITTGTVMSDDLSGFGPFTLGSTVEAQNPLPITLIALKVERKYGNIEFTWNAKGIHDFDYVEIEQSFDGIHYELTEKMNIQKTANGYLCSKVNSSLLTIYYRIKICRNNGHFFYSKPVLLIADVFTPGIVKIYPSRVTTQLNLQVMGRKKEPFVFVITDLNGRLIKTIKAMIMEGINNVHIPLPYVTTGLYCITVYGEKGMFGTVKFLKY